MNEELLALAREKVKGTDAEDVRIFINGVSRRAAQLARGARILISIPPNAEREWLDIALQEVAEGKVIIHKGEKPEEE